ncbi:MAG: hypothetical protein M3Z37_10955 [Candidatus Eremiobacteraeota bacterium]|nr:hypothetical protein [Candidatus Eremiobacteraeota bacterium]
MNPDRTDAGWEDARHHAAQAAKRLGRRRLSPGLVLLLWVLRLYVLIAVPLVVYAFFHALRR